MKNFDDLLSDAELRELAHEQDPTKNIRIPLQETTQPVQPVLNQKKKILISRLKKKRTEQLVSQSRIEQVTNPVIDTQQKSPTGLSILDVYKNAGLGVEKDKNFNVFRVESMLDDTSIIELDERAKEAAIVMALKTHGIDMASVVADGKDHLIALEVHDACLKLELDSMKARLEEENGRLHAEIERYANPRLERMEANQEKIDVLDSTYEKWLEEKEVEDHRLGKMVNRWTGKHVRVQAPPGIAFKTKRATEPLPLFGNGQDNLGEQSQSEEAPFLEPIVLEPSDMESSLVHESEVIKVREDLPVLTTPEVDLTSDMMIHSAGKKGGDVAYYFWMVASVMLWLFGGLNLAIIIETMKPVAALGLSFGIPLGIALFMGMISKGHGRWLGYIAFLGYCGLAIIFIAHLDIDNLAKLLSQDPIWLTESSNLDGHAFVLPEVIGKGLTSILNGYGEFLYSSGLASKP